MRFKNSKGLKKVAPAIAVLIAIAISLELISKTIPYISTVASKAAILSAGIALPEGGAKLLSQELFESWGGKTSEKPKVTSSQSDDLRDIDTGISQEEIDSYNQHDGPIIRKTYTPGEGEKYIPIGNGAYIYNTTKVDAQTVKNASQQKPAFHIEKNSPNPQVLIMHTHTTESYELAARDFYDNRSNARSRDQSRNVVRVGNEIAAQLQKAHINVIHDTTEHDYPSYNGSYDRSKVTDQKYLSQYPSIKVILDIHRDAITTSDGARYAPVKEINGKSAAQVMIISGCDDGTMDYPNYLQNLAFASLLGRQMNQDYPGLVRPISFKYKYYNQSLTSGSLLLEVGSVANSLEEAMYAGRLTGVSLAKALLSTAK